MIFGFAKPPWNRWKRDDFCSHGILSSVSKSRFAIIFIVLLLLLYGLLWICLDVAQRLWSALSGSWASI